jgi:hypothetical protein
VVCARLLDGFAQFFSVRPHVLTLPIRTPEEIW